VDARPRTRHDVALWVLEINGNNMRGAKLVRWKVAAIVDVVVRPVKQLLAFSFD
jgi:hypothetical protein